MAGTQLISGLVSGLDWRSIVDKLKAIDHRRVDLVSKKKTDYADRLKAWQALNANLLALKTSADSLNRASDFNLFTASLSSSSTTAATDILTATTSTSALPGTHTVEVLQTARAQKVSSKSFTSQSTALGASYAGAILINGRSLTIASTDTLVKVRDKINDLNSGSNASNVTASIMSFSSTDYRLVLTSQNEGAGGMGIQQVGSTNVLQSFGFITGTNSIKHATSDGAKSDEFTSAGTAVSSLLGLSSSPTGGVYIGGEFLTIDLSKTLTEIASDINGLPGVTAQVVSSTVNGSTVYQIDVSGTTSFTDANNVLQTLGILKGTYSSVQEIHLSDTANTKTTAAGGGNITSDTKWGEINTGGGLNNVANGDTITISGTKHDGTAVSDTYTITDKSTDTVLGLLTKIETVFGLTAGSATISAGKIQVTDNDSGDSALSITLTPNTANGDLNLGTLTASQQGYSMELLSGLDAQFKVDGNYLTRTSNTITDAITGVTLNLKKAASGTTVTVNVSRDTDGIYDRINDFVTKYNGVTSAIQTHLTYDTKNQLPGGVLFGDGTLKSVKSDLVNNLISQVWGVSSGFSMLGLVGINLDNKGQLTVTESTLKGYLQTNFEDVKKLFIANATTTIGTLDYVRHGLKTKPGTYAVNVTTAATQGSVTGAVDLSVGLSGNETLTILSGSAEAGISLTTGMSLSQIVSAINSELDQSYAEVIVGAKSLYADTPPTVKITNSTTWANVYDDTGTSAGLLNGDVISFSGTNRGGTAKSGSYIISDVNTDTVQGLLSAIEVAYNNTVIASIDTYGKITLTDKTTGTSSISLSIPSVRSLDFGTIDVDPTGADGSREGRYAIPATASASGDNKYLILTHDSYGSSNSFTVTQTNNLVLGAGKNGTYTGVNVVGTINSEAATGSGQTLTGNSGDANVDGLVVSYTGTSTGEVGSVTLTLGGAENFYRSLYYITDTYDGYVSQKQDSLQDRIDHLETQIEKMEDQLDRRMETLINQFVRMEKALSQLQNQSNWLTAQINGLNKL